MSSEHWPVELPVPTTAERPRTFEIARVFVEEKGPSTVTLRIDGTPDPAIWGVILADLARHVAKAYEQQSSHSFDKALSLVKTAFDVEWESPTDMPH